MTRLWELAVERSADDCLGLKVSHGIRPTSLHALGFAWLASDTLGAALARFERYCSVATTSIVAELEEHPDRYLLAFRPRQSSGAPAAADFAAATIVLVSLGRRRVLSPAGDRGAATAAIAGLPASHEVRAARADHV